MDTAGPNILILSKPEMLVTIISLFLHKWLKDVTIYSKYITEVWIHGNQKEQKLLQFGWSPAFFFPSEKQRNGKKYFLTLISGSYSSDF